MLFLIISLLIIIIDQITKNWITNHLSLGQTIFEGNPFLSITHIHNEGGGWSILEGKMWFFYIVTIMSIIVIGYLFVKYRHVSRWLTAGLCFILGGAIGNFIDRVRLGYVIDMFQFEFVSFPIFNVADIGITIGAICILIYLVVDEMKNKE